MGVAIAISQTYLDVLHSTLRLGEEASASGLSRWPCDYETDYAIFFSYSLEITGTLHSSSASRDVSPNAPFRDSQMRPVVNGKVHEE